VPKWRGESWPRTHATATARGRGVDASATTRGAARLSMLTDPSTPMARYLQIQPLMRFPLKSVLVPAHIHFCRAVRSDHHVARQNGVHACQYWSRRPRERCTHMRMSARAFSQCSARCVRASQHGVLPRE